MSILKICVIAVVGAIILMLLKNAGSILSAVLRCALIVFLFALIYPDLKELFEVLSSVDFPQGISLESIKIMLKIFGVLSIGSIGADICRDNGETGLGNIVELCVKIAAVSLSLPIITAVITTATSFAGG